MSDTIRWLTVDDAAERACCRPITIRRAVQKGRLQVAYVGRRRELRFLERWIEEWLNGRVMPEDGEIHVAINVMPSRSRVLSAR